MHSKTWLLDFSFVGEQRPVAGGTQERRALDVMVICWGMRIQSHKQAA